MMTAGRGQIYKYIHAVIERIHFEAFSQKVSFLKKKLNFLPEFSDIIHFVEYLEY